MTRNDLLSQQEAEALLIALAKGAKKKGAIGFTEEEAEFVISWAEKIKVNSAILNIVLGKVGKEENYVTLEIRPDTTTGVLDVAVGIFKREESKDTAVMRNTTVTSDAKNKEK